MLNGTVSPLTAKRITEVHDAQREQKRENCVGDECMVEVSVEPFPHEDEVMAGAEGEAEAEGDSAEGEASEAGEAEGQEGEARDQEAEAPGEAGGEEVSGGANATAA